MRQISRAAATVSTWMRRVAAIRRTAVIAVPVACIAVGAIVATPAAIGAQASAGSKIVAAAASMQGKHYCDGGGSVNGPTHGSGNSLGDGATYCGSSSVKGFDCTGLTQYAVYQATHITLPHGQGIGNVKGGTRITRESQLQLGDVILFGGTWSHYEHAGIYAGSQNGQMMMWDANIRIAPYSDGVQKRSLAWETGGPHGLNFIGAVRF